MIQLFLTHFLCIIQEHDFSILNGEVEHTSNYWLFAEMCHLANQTTNTFKQWTKIKLFGLNISQAGLAQCQNIDVTNRSKSACKALHY